MQKIHESAFVLMIIGFVLAFLFGPVFCGGIRQLAYLESHTIPNPAAASDSLEAAPASATESAPEAGATPAQPRAKQPLSAWSKARQLSRKCWVGD